MTQNSPPEGQKAITRFQAQRAFGLYAPHDFVMLGLAVGSLVGNLLYVYITSEPHLHCVVLWLGATLIFLLAWLIVLAYRILVFILDLHADIALMPEASARIAVGFLQGQPPKK